MLTEKNFTFGFEIEGFFEQSLQPKVKGEFKEDGSVHIDQPFKKPVILDDINCEGCNGRGYYDGDEDNECGDCGGCGTINMVNESASEYASPVFASLKKLIAELELFDEERHAWGSGCGLHLHIGLKDKRQAQKDKFWSVAANFEFMDKLYELLSTKACLCQAKRLRSRDTSYYQRFGSQNEIKQNLGDRGSSKYRMVRLHPEYKTLEFRLLCPCQHKINNVKTVVSILLEYLNSNSEIEVKSEAETVQAKFEAEPIKITMPIMSDKKWVNKQSRLNKYISEVRQQHDFMSKEELDNVISREIQHFESMYDSQAHNPALSYGIWTAYNIGESIGGND